MPSVPFYRTLEAIMTKRLENIKKMDIFQSVKLLMYTHMQQQSLFTVIDTEFLNLTGNGIAPDSQQDCRFILSTPCIP